MDRRLVVIILGLGLACSSPSKPTPISTTTSSPPFTVDPAELAPVTVNVRGRVIDVDSDKPLPRAAVTPFSVCAPGVPSLCQDLIPPASSSTADANGVFTLSVNIPKNWTVLHFRISRDGFEPGNDLVQRAEATDARLWVAPTLTIGPGESLTIPRFLHSWRCGWEEILCRRIMVSASPDKPADVEVVGVEGQSVGISNSRAPFGFPSDSQVTVSGGELWIYAGAPKESAARGVFDQRVTVRARRH